MNHFKGKQFQKDVIIISVGYYLHDSLDCNANNNPQLQLSHLFGIMLLE